MNRRSYSLTDYETISMIYEPTESRYSIAFIARPRLELYYHNLTEYRSSKDIGGRDVRFAVSRSQT